MIEVEAGDEIFEFPDNTPDDVMRGALQKRFRQPAAGNVEVGTTGEPDVLPDVAKSAGVGLGEGAIGVAGLPGDLSNLIGRGVRGGLRMAGMNVPEGAEAEAAKRRVLGGADISAPGSEAIQSTVEKATGPFYEPKTVPGQYARTGGQFASGALFPGGAARRAAQVAVPAAVSETGGQATEGTEAEPYFRAAGALAGGAVAAGVANKASKLGAYKGAPAADDLGDVVDEGYKKLKGMGAEFKSDAVARNLQKIKTDQQIDVDSAPKTAKLLDGLESKATMGPMTGRAGITFDEIDAVRKKLGKVGRNYQQAEDAAAARAAIRAIDDNLAHLNPKNVLKGDAKEVSRVAKETRGNAAAEFRTRALESIKVNAEAADSPAAAYRAGLKAFTRLDRKGKSPAHKEGFNDREIKVMRTASKAVSMPVMLRIIGKLGGQTGWYGSGAASLYMQDPTYMAAAGVGTGARGLANALTRRRAGSINRMAASRSPMAQQAGVRPPQLTSPIQAGLLGMVNSRE